VQDARNDLAHGKAFEDVATARSVDRFTAPNGGELPAFTRQDNRFPEEFKQLAFALSKGQVSDSLQLGKFIYIVKLIDRIPPEHAKFEDYRDAVEKDLLEQATQGAMTAMRQRLGKMALDTMHITDPVLAAQWQDKLTKKSGELHDMNDIRQKWDEQHSTTEPTTGPAGGPTTIPSTIPSATLTAPGADALTAPGASASGPATAPAAK
jgi:hypothetical protein